MLWLGGLVCCSTCGGMTATDAATSRLLRAHFRRVCPEGSAARVRRVAEGRLPYGWTAWPDGRAEASAVRAPLQLRWDPEAENYTVDRA